MWHQETICLCRKLKCDYLFNQTLWPLKRLLVRDSEIDSENEKYDSVSKEFRGRIAELFLLVMWVEWFYFRRLPFEAEFVELYTCFGFPSSCELYQNRISMFPFMHINAGPFDFVSPKAFQITELHSYSSNSIFIEKDLCRAYISPRSSCATRQRGKSPRRY